MGHSKFKDDVYSISRMAVGLGLVQGWFMIALIRGSGAGAHSEMVPDGYMPDYPL